MALQRAGAPPRPSRAEPREGSAPPPTASGRGCTHGPATGTSRGVRLALVPLERKGDAPVPRKGRAPAGSGVSQAAGFRGGWPAPEALQRPGPGSACFARPWDHSSSVQEEGRRGRATGTVRARLKQRRRVAMPPRSRRAHRGEDGTDGTAAPLLPPLPSDIVRPGFGIERQRPLRAHPEHIAGVTRCRPFPPRPTSSRSTPAS